jgi:hypothetical protein
MPKNLEIKLQFNTLHFLYYKNSHNNMDMEIIAKVCTFHFIGKNPFELQQNSMLCGNEIKTTK